MKEKFPKKERSIQGNPHIEERPFWGEFRGGEIDEAGGYKKPTPEQKEKFEKRIERVSEIFENANFQWYLDGAPNISLYGDKQIRGHKDLDVSIFKEDLSKLDSLLSGHGFGIFVNFEKNGKRLMKKVTTEELLTLEKPDLSICKVDSSGKIQKKTSDSFNFVDLHIHSKDAEGNTVISYNGAALPKEFFEPVKKVLPNGKKINLSQPAVVAYHKLHSDRPYDLTDLQRLRPNLQEKDFGMLKEILGREIKETDSKVKEKLQEAWDSLSSTLELTHDSKVISERIWTHPDLEKRRSDPKVSEYVSSISQYISENPGISFEAFLNQSLSILKSREQAEQKLKILGQLESSGDQKKEAPAQRPKIKIGAGAEAYREELPENNIQKLWREKRPMERIHGEKSKQGLADKETEEIMRLKKEESDEAETGTVKPYPEDVAAEEEKPVQRFWREKQPLAKLHGKKGGDTYREELPENNIQAIEEKQPGQEEIPEEGKESSPGYIPGWEDALTEEEPEEDTEKQIEEKQPGREETPGEDKEGYDDDNLGEDALPNEKEIESQIEEAGAKERVGPMDPDFLIILFFAVIVDAIDIVLELTSFLVIPKLIGIVIDAIVFLIIGGWMYWRTKKISESKKAALSGITKSLQSQVKKLERLRKIGKVDQKVFDRYVRRYTKQMGKMGTSLAKAARSPFGRTIIKSSLACLGEIIVIIGLIPFWTISVVLMLREE